MVCDSLYGSGRGLKFSDAELKKRRDLLFNESQKLINQLSGYSETEIQSEILYTHTPREHYKILKQ